MGIIRGIAMEASHKARQKTGCSALPKIIDFAGKNMEQVLASRTQEFYEFILPPVDLQSGDGVIIVSVDLPGYNRDQIKIRMSGNVLSISGQRDPVENTIYAQRPNVIHKDIRLPTHIKRGEEPECSASLDDGVLRVTVPIPQSGIDISINN